MCITWKAAGEGRARGRTGACSMDDEGGEELGKRGSEAHCEASTILWMGNIKACSLGEDFEDPTASIWVGYVGWPEVVRIGMESEGGSWDFAMEVGMDNAAIPASILRRQNIWVR